MFWISVCRAKRMSHTLSPLTPGYATQLSNPCCLGGSPSFWNIYFKSTISHSSGNFSMNWIHREKKPNKMAIKRKREKKINPRVPMVLLLASTGKGKVYVAHVQKAHQGCHSLSVCYYHTHLTPNIHHYQPISFSTPFFHFLKIFMCMHTMSVCMYVSIRRGLKRVLRCPGAGGTATSYLS